MASTSKSEISLWLVRPIKGGARRFKLSRRSLYILAAVIGVSVGLLSFVVGDYIRFVVEDGASFRELSALVKEHRELKSEKKRLQREIALLKSQSTEELNKQQSLKSTMDELHAVLESSAALGLFSHTPRANSNSNQKLGRRLKEINRALGGAEIECSRGSSGKIVCSSSGEKRPISGDEIRASLKPDVISATAETFSGETGQLAIRIRRYLELLRRLPIGSPVKGEVTSGYGYRQSPFSGHSSFHQGIDISIPEGKKVVSTADGIVTKSERHPTYGWLVEVDHYDGITTRYAHLLRPNVIVDQLVHRGSVIGLSGCTGRSTGPHVHYEILVRGRPRNPTSFMQLAGKLRRFL